MGRSLAAALVLVALWFAPAVATEDDALTAQFGLILSGYYTGPADGMIGPRSRNAIASFQRELGEATTGELTERQFLELQRRFENALVSFGIYPVVDETTGVWLYLPAGMLAPEGPTERGFRFVGTRAGFELETVRIDAADQSFLELYVRLTRARAGRTIDYSSVQGDWFVVQSREGPRRLYTRFFSNGLEHRGFSVAFDAQADRELLPLVYFLSEVFFPFSPVEEDAFRVPSDLAEAPSPPAAPAPTPPPREPGTPPAHPAGPVLVGTGSGFFVNAEGVIVTNAHVADGCSRLALGDGQPVALDYIDHALDLALLRGGATGQHLTIAPGDLALGQDVVVLGFPLSDILDDGLRVTEGVVSGVTGLRGDRTRFTITAPVQPGNSGGPVLDRQGRVVGVVVSVLSASRAAERGDPMPQNVNFGIRPEILRMILSISGERAADPAGKVPAIPLTTERIAGLASGAVVQILCYR